MRPQVLIRKAHRWLGLAIGVQLLAWTASGLYFSIIPIEEIRGEHLTLAPEEPLEDLPPNLLDPGRAAQRLAAVEVVDRLESLTLIRRGERFYYRAQFAVAEQTRRRLIDAVSGRVEPPLNEAGARARAQRLFKADVPVLQAEYVTAVAPDSEYRGKELPAWRLRMDHSSGAVLYLAAATGELTARRTDAWRVFDFLWMLHILDFEARDDFNQWLLRSLAALGVVTILSGFALWIATTPLLRRRP